MPTINDWAQQQWGTAQLGDQRRTHRAVRLGAQMARHPAASLPQQTQSWPDLKAAYRLLHEDQVTHEALSLPHWTLTRHTAQHCAGPVLFIQDGSQLDFSGRQADGLGRIGNDQGQGLLFHSTLAVQPGAGRPVLGLAHQLVWAREGEPYQGRETRRQRYDRAQRESDHWFGALQAIGQVPPQACWVSVGDRESDIFAYWCQAQALGWECLLRLAQDRTIVLADQRTASVLQWARQLPAQAQHTLQLRTRPERPARQARLSVAWSRTRILAPGNDPSWHKQAPLTAWVLRVWEAAAPAGEPPLEWRLLSTLPVESAEQAQERIEWYRCRWLIEQYHKALKTGCRFEQSQLQQGAALRRLLGLLSIVAVRLLQVASIARSTPGLPAGQVVDAQLLALVCQLRQLDPGAMTMYQFWREVAKFGGFLARKRDGEPGWQTLWRGWQELCPLFEGYLLGQQCG